MTRTLFACLLAAGLPVAARAQAPAPDPETATFVIRHGADTVATEQVSRTATEIKGELSLAHSKTGTSERYRAVVAPDATLPLVEVTVGAKAPSPRERAPIEQRTRVIFKGDSVAVDDASPGGLQTRIIGTEAGAMPYLNLSFGLLEQTLRRSATLGTGTVKVPLFNLSRSHEQYGGQTVPATITRLGADSVSLAIGSVDYRLKVDSTGRLMGGGIPSQQLSFERVRGR